MRELRDGIHAAARRRPLLHCDLQDARLSVAQGSRDAVSAMANRRNRRNITKMNRRIERARSRKQAKVLGNSPVVTLYDRDRSIGVSEAPSRRRQDECRCGKKLRETATAEDLEKYPDRKWWQCDSCRWHAHREKGKRTEWFPPSLFRAKTHVSITAPLEKSRPTDHRLKHPRPGGPHSHKTY
jgi:hypothetical protein